MNGKFKQLLAALPDNNLPTALCDRVMKRIEASEFRRAKAHAYLNMVVAVLAAVALVPAVTYFISGISGSGFFSYASLAFSDGSYMLAHARDFLLPLVSSWPIAGSLAVLAALIVLVNSMRRAAMYSSATPSNGFAFN